MLRPSSSAWQQAVALQQARQQAAAAAGKQQQRSGGGSSPAGSGQPQDVVAAWAERLTVPWGPLLTQEEAERGLSYWGSGERLKRFAAKLMAGKPVKVRGGSSLL